MKRLIELTHEQARKIRARQLAGTMTELYDEEKYLCFDEKELEKWKPKKVGRKPKGRK